LRELKGKSFLTFVLEDDRPIFQQKLAKLNLKVPVLIYECNTANYTGDITWYQWTIRAVFSKPGKIGEYQAIGRDISQHRKAEKDLLETKKRYEAVVEDQAELVCRYLPDGTLIFANQAYCRYHGKKKSELLGRSIFPNIRHDYREKLRAFIRTTSPDHPSSTEVQCITRNDGEDRWVEWHRRAFFDDSGKLREIQSVGRDITELKIAEDALKYSEKTLREKNIELERKNVALTEVLDQIEQQKQQIKDDVITNVDDLLIPVLDQLVSKGSKLDGQYLNLIKRSLKDLTASFGRKITEKSLKLTPKEILVCNMIRRGLTSKEIGNFLNISLNTVGRHRHSIRKKAELIEKRQNLHTFLQSM
jgi:PAS domain S-box-containing protein